MYDAFASSSIYLGLTLLTMLVCITAEYSFGQLAFFWIMILPLSLAPFIFNPHQFRITDFFEDYAELIHWFSRGNSKFVACSWHAFHMVQRAKITGHKRAKKAGYAQNGFSRASVSTLLINRVIIPWIVALICALTYAIGIQNPKSSLSGLLMIFGISFLPCLLNLMITLVIFPIALLFGPWFSCCSLEKYFANGLSIFAHTFAIIGNILAFVVCAAISEWHFPRTILGVSVMIHVQSAFTQTMTSILSREIQKYPGYANIAFWNGSWFGTSTTDSSKFHLILQPFREFLCKWIELTSFAGDFIACHIILFILFPFCLIPFIDRFHTRALLWINPKRSLLKSASGKRVSFTFALSKFHQQKRKRRIIYGSILFAVMFVLFIGLMVGPFVVSVPVRVRQFIPI